MAAALHLHAIDYRRHVCDGGVVASDVVAQPALDQNTRIICRMHAILRVDELFALLESAALRRNQHALARKREDLTGFSLIIKRSNGGLIMVRLMPTALLPAKHHARSQTRLRMVTDVHKVSVRLKAHKHKRRSCRSSQARHKKRGHFDGKCFRADNER
jgi:hypothetical protein